MKTFGDLFNDYNSASGVDATAAADVTAKQSALDASVQAKATADGALSSAATALAGVLAGTPGLLLGDGTLLTTGADGKLKPPVKVPTLADVAIPDAPPVPDPNQVPGPVPMPVPNGPLTP